MLGRAKWIVWLLEKFQTIRVNWTPLSLMSKPTPRQFKYITKYANVFSTMYYVYRNLQGCMNDYVFITNNDLQQVKFLISTYYWGPQLNKPTLGCNIKCAGYVSSGCNMSRAPLRLFIHARRHSHCLLSQDRVKLPPT